MFFEMLAYFVWIVLTLITMGFFFHILHMDQPQPVRVPVRRDDLP
jgi:hypothetical protein